MTEYDPSPLVWLPTIPFLRQRTDWTPSAAVMMQSRIIFTQVDEVPWSPERDLLVEERRLITPQEFRSSPSVIQADARLLHYLDERPEQILSLSWRQFEILVADLLERLGYRVDVGRLGRDGGIDIRADRTTDVGPELVLVQCKRFASTRKVSEPTVKQLCMVVEDEQATRGLIVTTSSFTSVALKYIEKKKYKVSGADLVKLKEWIRIARGR